MHAGGTAEGKENPGLSTGACGLRLELATKLPQHVAEVVPDDRRLRFDHFHDDLVLWTPVTERLLNVAFDIRQHAQLVSERLRDPHMLHEEFHGLLAFGLAHAGLHSEAVAGRLLRSCLYCVCKLLGVAAHDVFFLPVYNARRQAT